MKQVVNYLFDPQKIADLYLDFKLSYEARTGNEYNAETIGKICLSYLRDEPKAYLRFGVYYGAVLKALDNLGLMPAGVTNDEPPILIDAYTIPETDDISSEILTIIAAFEFKKYYNANLFQGSDTFYPFEDDTPYRLHNINMEMYAIS